MSFLLLELWCVCVFPFFSVCWNLEKEEDGKSVIFSGLHLEKKNATWTGNHFGFNEISLIMSQLLSS